MSDSTISNSSDAPVSLNSDICPTDVNEMDLVESIIRIMNQKRGSIIWKFVRQDLIDQGKLQSTVSKNMLISKFENMRRKIVPEIIRKKGSVFFASTFFRENFILLIVVGINLSELENYISTICIANRNKAEKPIPTKKWKSQCMSLIEERNSRELDPFLLSLLESWNSLWKENLNLKEKQWAVSMQMASLRYDIRNADPDANVHYEDVRNKLLTIQDSLRNTNDSDFPITKVVLKQRQLLNDQEEELKMAKESLIMSHLDISELQAQLKALTLSSVSSSATSGYSSTSFASSSPSSSCQRDNLVKQE